MSEIEIVVSVLVLFMGFMTVYSTSKVREIKEDIQDLFDKLGEKVDLKDLTSVNSLLGELKEEMGYAKKSYYKVLGGLHAPSQSVHQRINLLMDHLNLEIKEGEPSTTVLVKKKPIKRGK